jgi:ribose transport system substrate-binding protein
MLNSTELSRGRRLRSACVTGMALVLALTGCAEGGTSDSGQAGSDSEAIKAEAEQIVSEVEAPFTWTVPGPAIDVSSLTGKRVLVVTAGLSEFIQNINAGMRDAAEHAGVDLTFNNPERLADAAQAIEQGTAQDYDAIVINSWDTGALMEPIRAATSADIPVIQMFDADPGPLTENEKEAGVYANVAVCFECGGRYMADMALAERGNEVNALLVVSPEVPTGLLEAQGFQDEMERLCPECTVKVAEVPIANWNTQLATTTASALSADPDLNYIAPVFDSMAAFMIPSVFAANAADRVRILSMDGDQAPMKQMQSGAEPEWAGNAGFDHTWAGWAAMDNVYRALLGEPPVQDNNLQLRLFRPSNVADLDLDAHPTTWYGEAEYRTEYPKLWGAA